LNQPSQRRVNNRFNLFGVCSNLHQNRPWIVRAQRRQAQAAIRESGDAVEEPYLLGDQRIEVEPAGEACRRGPGPCRRRPAR
jgi:hypothetical protein